VVESNRVPIGVIPTSVLAVGLRDRQERFSAGGWLNLTASINVHSVGGQHKAPPAQRLLLAVALCHPPALCLL
jgi:hypothetical protein